MLILMTVDTEIFPVRPIGRIVPVVAILVMNGQKMAVLVFKLSSAFGAYQTMNLQGLFPVVGRDGTSP